MRTPRLSTAVLTTLLVAVSLGAMAGPPASLREVVVVFKTHFDLGYTDMASNVVQRYRTSMIDDALKVVDANRDLPAEQQFVWTLAGWPLAQILEEGPGQTPERQARVKAAFKQGRFVAHALPFTTHTELLEPEDLVRGLGFASRLSREAEQPLPRDAKMTDVPSHSWFLPTLLRQAGVDFLHLGCNAASRSPVVPRLFFWEGPDGSRLLTMYTAESYGTGLVPPADWPYRTWLALIHTGDNHGPPRPDEVKALLEEARQKLPGVIVRIGRLSDFADGILADQSPVPVVRGDMPDTWIHGPLSDPRGASLARHVRSEILTTELLSGSLPAWGRRVPPPASTLAKAYEQSLLYGEHTWGGAYWWIYGKYQAFYGERWQAERAAGRFARIESSWDEHTSYIESAARGIRPVQAGQLQALARSVKTPGPRWVVFNPLPWKRDGRVEFPRLPAGPRAWRPLEAEPGFGSVVTVSNPDEPHRPVSLFVRDIPAGGYRTFVPAEPPLAQERVRFDPATGGIETPFFRAQVDPRLMVLTSLIEKPTGRELVRPASRSGVGFGQYVYERFSANEVDRFVKAYVKIDADWATNELGKPMLPSASAESYRRGSPSGFRMGHVVESDRLRIFGVSTNAPGLGGEFRVEFVFYADQPHLDLEMTLDKPAEPWPEAGWMALPFEVDAPQFRLSRLGSVVDPAADLVPGSNRHLFAVNGGVKVTDPREAGVGLCGLDSPLVSLGEPGCWKYSIGDFPRAPTVYVNLFNNQWTTNFRLWTEEAWTSRVRIWAVRPESTPEAALVTPSLEARYPLVTAFADGDAGDGPAEAKGVELSERGSLVTAYGPNPDGAGTVLRLWELSGRSGPCRVTLPEGARFTRVQPVDLRGRSVGAPLGMDPEGRFTVSQRAFAPLSLVLEP